MKKMSIKLRERCLASQFGLEITYPLMKYLDVGARYSKRLLESDEEPSSSSTDYSARVDQDSLLLVARVPFVKSDIFRLDAFVGMGGSNTNLKMKTASQDGELTRKASEGWFASPYAAVGTSAAIGYKQFYFILEGGIETNKVNGFDRSGSVSNGIDTLDLSGSYFGIGLMFDGIPGSVK